MHAAFAAVFGRPDLWVDHDRLGVMPATRGAARGPQRTVDNWLHLDCNPVSYGERGRASIGGFADDGSPVDFRRTLIIQGFLSLTDARAADGGFHCVPGSHRICRCWARGHQGNPQDSEEHMQVPADDPLRAHIQQIPVRRGCLVAWTSLLMHGNYPNQSERMHGADTLALVAWTSLLMHGNYPNQSERMRAVQYIRMLPPGTPYTPLLEHPRQLPRELELTPLAARLLGFAPWPPA